MQVKGEGKLEGNGRESSGTSRLGKTKEQEKSLKCLTTLNFPATLESFPRGNQLGFLKVSEIHLISSKFSDSL